MKEVPHFSTQQIWLDRSRPITIILKIMANETRQKIVSTTSTLLERQGYNATGLKQILTESGTPRGSLYHYFPDGKEELASEAIIQSMERMAMFTRRHLGEVDDAAEAIYAMIMDVAVNMERHSCSTGAPIAAVALETSNTNERLREVCAAGYQKLRDILAAKLVMSGFSAEKAIALSITINAAIEGGMILSRTAQNASILVNVANDIKTLVQTASLT